MKRILRILFILIILTGLLIAGAVWGLNAYVQSDSFQAQVKAQVSEIAGVPVEFSDVQWDIGRGITVIGLRLEHQEPGTRPAVFLCPRIHLKYDWASLWNWRFDVNELTFKEPEVRVTQNPEGDYVLPFKASETTVEAAPSAPALAIVFRHFNLDKGRFEVTDNEQASRLQMEGVRIEATRPGNGGGSDFRMEGLIKVRTVTLWETLAMHVISSPISYRDGMLKLSALEADTYGGRLIGVWEQDFNDTRMPYNLTLNAEGVNVSRVMSEALGRPGLLNGRLEAATVWLGPATDPLQVTGHGTAEITNGQVINLPFFRQMAALLGNLPVLAKPDFSEAKMDFKVANQRIDITAFSFKSALFELKGTGVMGFDLKLDGKLRLALNPQLARQIPGELRKVLEKRADNYVVVPLKLSGTVDEPKVSLAVDAGLMNRAVDTIFNLLGGDRNKEQAPPATPVTPAP